MDISELCGFYMFLVAALGIGMMIGGLKKEENK